MDDAAIRINPHSDIRHGDLYNDILILNHTVCGEMYPVRVITVFTVFRLLTDFVCLYTYEF